MSKNEKQVVDQETGEVLETAADLAIVQEQHETGVAYFSEEAKYWCSFNPQTLEEKAQIVASMSNPTYKIDAVMGKRKVLVKNILAHKVQLTDDKTGEVVEADRIVLICPNGETIAGVSVGFKSSINNIMNVFGKPPWDSLPLFIDQVTTRKGNRTYSVLVDFNSTLPTIGEVK